METAIYVVFGAVIFLSIYTFALIIGDQDDEMFFEEVNENASVIPQYECVICKKKYWSWQMMNATTCIDCYRKKIGKGRHTK